MRSCLEFQICVGYLFYAEVNMLLKFLKCIGHGDSNLAEILTINEAFQLVVGLMTQC